MGIVGRARSPVAKEHIVAELKVQRVEARHDGHVNEVDEGAVVHVDRRQQDRRARRGWVRRDNQWRLTHALPLLKVVGDHGFGIVASSQVDLKACNGVTAAASDVKADANGLNTANLLRPGLYARSDLHYKTRRKPVALLNTNY